MLIIIVFSLILGMITSMPTYIIISTCTCRLAFPHDMHVAVMVQISISTTRDCVIIIDVKIVVSIIIHIQLASHEQKNHTPITYVVSRVYYTLDNVYVLDHLMDMLGHAICQWSL